MQASHGLNYYVKFETAARLLFSTPATPPPQGRGTPDPGRFGPPPPLGELVGPGPLPSSGAKKKSLIPACPQRIESPASASFDGDQPRDLRDEVRRRGDGRDQGGAGWGTDGGGSFAPTFIYFTTETLFDPTPGKSETSAQPQTATEAWVG